MTSQDSLRNALRNQSSAEVTCVTSQTSGKPCFPSPDTDSTIPCSDDQQGKVSFQGSAACSCPLDDDFSADIDSSAPGIRRTRLTAKYQKHQLSLIRKLLAVEDWIEKSLLKLYDNEGDGGSSAAETLIDIDTLLGIDGDSDRITYLKNQLRTVTKPQSDVTEFVQQLLEKVKTL
jgi:hypothetical protein